MANMGDLVGFALTVLLQAEAITRNTRRYVYVILIVNIDVSRYTFTVLRLFNIPIHFFIFRAYAVDMPLVWERS